MIARILLAPLVLCCTFAASAEHLPDFELADQHGRTHRHAFPKDKATVLFVADRKGSEQLEPWIQRLHDEYAEDVEILGIADVSMIAAPFRAMFRAAFRGQLVYPVMLDWEGAIIDRLARRPDVANIFVIARTGEIRKHLSGPMTDRAFRELAGEVVRTASDQSE